MTKLYKVKMTDEVNGQQLTFTCEYTAANEFAAQILACREFGHNEKLRIISTERVVY